MDLRNFPTLILLPRNSSADLLDLPSLQKFSTKPIYKLQISPGNAEPDLDKSIKLPLFKHKYYEQANNRPYVIKRSAYHFSLLYLKLEELFGKRIKADFDISRFVKKNQILTGPYGESLINQKIEAIVQFVRVIFYSPLSAKYRTSIPVLEFFGPWLSDFASPEELSDYMVSPEDEYFRIPSLSFSKPNIHILDQTIANLNSSNPNRSKKSPKYNPKLDSVSEMDFIKLDKTDIPDLSLPISNAISTLSVNAKARGRDHTLPSLKPPNADPSTNSRSSCTSGDGGACSPDTTTTSYRAGSFSNSYLASKSVKSFGSDIKDRNKDNSSSSPTKSKKFIINKIFDSASRVIRSASTNSHKSKKKISDKSPAFSPAQGGTYHHTYTNTNTASNNNINSTSDDSKLNSPSLSSHTNIFKQLKKPNSPENLFKINPKQKQKQDSTSAQNQSQNESQNQNQNQNQNLYSNDASISYQSPSQPQSQSQPQPQKDFKRPNLKLNLDTSRQSYINWGSSLQSLANKKLSELHQIATNDPKELLSNENQNKDTITPTFDNSEYSSPYYFDSYYQLFSESTAKMISRHDHSDFQPSPPSPSTNNNHGLGTPKPKPYLRTASLSSPKSTTFKESQQQPQTYTRDRSAFINRRAGYMGKADDLTDNSFSLRRNSHRKSNNPPPLQGGDSPLPIKEEELGINQSEPTKSAKIGKDLADITKNSDDNKGKSKNESKNKNFNSSSHHNPAAGSSIQTETPSAPTSTKRSPIIVDVYENDILLTNFFTSEEFDLLKLKDEIENNINTGIDDDTNDPNYSRIYIKNITNLSLSYANDKKKFSTNSIDEISLFFDQKKQYPVLQISVVTEVLPRSSSLLAGKNDELSTYSIDVTPEVGGDHEIDYEQDQSHKINNINDNYEDQIQAQNRTQYDSNTINRPVTKSGAATAASGLSITSIPTIPSIPSNINLRETEIHREQETPREKEKQKQKQAESKIPISKSDLTRAYSQKVLQVYGRDINDVVQPQENLQQLRPNDSSVRLSRNHSRSGSRNRSNLGKDLSNDSLSGLNIILGTSVITTTVTSATKQLSREKSNASSVKHAGAPLDSPRTPNNLNQSTESKLSFYSFINSESPKSIPESQSQNYQNETESRFEKTNSKLSARLKPGKLAQSPDSASLFSPSSGLSLSHDFNLQKVEGSSSVSRSGSGSGKRSIGSKKNSFSNVSYLANYENINDLPIPKIPVSDSNSNSNDNDNPFNAYLMQTSEPSAPELHISQSLTNVPAKVSTDDYFKVINNQYSNETNNLKDHAKKNSLILSNSTHLSRSASERQHTISSGLSRNRSKSSVKAVESRRSMELNSTKQFESQADNQPQIRNTTQDNALSDSRAKAQRELQDLKKPGKFGIVRSLTMRTKKAINNVKRSNSAREKLTNFRAFSSPLLKKKTAGPPETELKITQVKSHFEDYQSAITTTRKFESKRVLSTIRDSRYIIGEMEQQLRDKRKIHTETMANRQEEFIIDGVKLVQLPVLTDQQINTLISQSSLSVSKFFVKSESHKSALLRNDLIHFKVTIGEDSSIVLALSRASTYNTLRDTILTKLNSCGFPLSSIKKLAMVAMTDANNLVEISSTSDLTKLLKHLYTNLESARIPLPGDEYIPSPIEANMPKIFSPRLLDLDDPACEHIYKVNIYMAPLLTVDKIKRAITLKLNSLPPVPSIQTPPQNQNLAQTRNLHSSPSQNHMHTVNTSTSNVSTDIDTKKNINSNIDQNLSPCVSSTSQYQDNVRKLDVIPESPKNSLSLAG